MFEKSADTETISKLLLGANDDISYSTIAAAVGKPLSAIRGAISTARRILEREKIVFATVRGHGLRRLGDGEKVRSTEATKASIRRASRRGIRRLDAVENIGSLSNADQITATINRTIFEAVRTHTVPAKTHEVTRAERGPTPNIAALMPP